MDNQTGTERRPARAPLSETPAFLIAIGACVICAAYWLLLIKVYHFTNRQAVELAAYLLSVVAILVAGSRTSRYPPIPAGTTSSATAARHGCGAGPKTG